jgi:hypothetical protein
MTRRGAVPDLFTLPELEAYAADDWDPVRAPTIHALTLGTVYGLIPEAVADTSVRAKAIGPGGGEAGDGAVRLGERG